MTKPAVEDLEARRPAWDALSDLFLDTDTSCYRTWRATTLARTAYSIDELESILVEEVEPVCRWNTLSIAGAWAGFDPVWLEKSILKRLNRPKWLRYPSFAKWTMPRDNEWVATKNEIEMIRARAGLEIDE